MKTIPSSAGFSRKCLLRSVRLIWLGVIAAGCSQQAGEKVVIRGSNTIGEELAPRLIAEFRKQHPTVFFDTEFKGTSYGLGALMVERCDIAAASRETTMNELGLARDRSLEFNNYTIGSYSVAVIVNATNPLAKLTRDNVREIFTGGVQNWKEVGGPDAPIHLHIRDPISGTHLGFRELAMDNKPYALSLKTHTNYAEIVRAVAGDANGIGYSSLELSVKPGIKAVSIGDVAPTVPSVNKGEYPYTRLLRLYTNKGKETQATRDFIQFVESERGQKILDEMGFVPRP